MAQIDVGGISLEYDRFGPEDRETVLLIMGLGAQMTRWPVALCETLVERGFQVIRFDNRDIGLSSKLDHLGQPDIGALFAARAAGKSGVPPYTLDDMARDAVGLLERLGEEAREGEAGDTLAAAAFADDGECLAAGHGEGNAFDGFDVARFGGKIDGEVFDVEEGLVGHGVRWLSGRRRDAGRRRGY